MPFRSRSLRVLRRLLGRALLRRRVTTDRPHTCARYMLYFRVRHVSWGALVGDRALEADLWCDLEGTWAHLGRE